MLYPSCWNSGSVGYWSVFGWCGWCWREWVGGLGQDLCLGRWCSVMSVCVVSVDYLCRWQVQVFVYCARLIPVHRRCTQCSILLHLIDICFLMCICLWHVSQIQTYLRVVVGPGLVSTSPAFMRISVRHPAGPGWLACPKTVSRGGRDRHNLHSGLPYRSGSSTACRLCRLETRYVSNHRCLQLRMNNKLHGQINTTDQNKNQPYIIQAECTGRFPEQTNHHNIRMETQHTGIQLNM